MHALVMSVDYNRIYVVWAPIPDEDPIGILYNIGILIRFMPIFDLAGIEFWFG